MMMLKPVGERKDNDANQDNSNQASSFQDNSYEVMFVNGQPGLPIASWNF